MYCGNNAEDPDLKQGRKKRGTRYECLQKGIGVGLSLPFDDKYSKKYVPIDRRKIWCGKSNKLPDDYDLMGSTGMCYTKGVGIGRSIKAKKKGSKKRSKQNKQNKQNKRKSK